MIAWGGFVKLHIIHFAHGTRIPQVVPKSSNLKERLYSDMSRRSPVQLSSVGPSIYARKTHVHWPSHRASFTREHEPNPVTTWDFITPSLQFEGCVVHIGVSVGSRARVSIGKFPKYSMEQKYAHTHKANEKVEELWMLNFSNPYDWL